MVLAVQVAEKAPEMAGDRMDPVGLTGRWR